MALTMNAMEAEIRMVVRKAFDQIVNEEADAAAERVKARVPEITKVINPVFTMMRIDITDQWEMRLKLNHETIVQAMRERFKDR